MAFTPYTRGSLGPGEELPARAGRLDAGVEVGALLVPPSAQGQLLVEHRESGVAAGFNKRRQEAA